MGSLIVCTKTRTCFDRPGAMAVDLTFCSQQLHVVSICIFLLFFRFRLNVYKAIGNQKILTPAGGSQLICGDTLKVMFGCRTRAYLQLGTTGTPGEWTLAEQGLGETQRPGCVSDQADNCSFMRQCKPELHITLFLLVIKLNQDLILCYNQIYKRNQD